MLLSPCMRAPYSECSKPWAASALAYLAHKQHRNAVFQLNSRVPRVRASSQAAVASQSPPTYIFKKVWGVKYKWTQLYEPPGASLYTVGTDLTCRLPLPTVVILLSQRLLTLETWCGYEYRRSLGFYSNYLVVTLYPNAGGFMASKHMTPYGVLATSPVPEKLHHIHSARSQVRHSLSALWS